MMAGVVRLGDSISHGGVVTTASSNLKANGSFVARVDDLVSCTEHGTNAIVSTPQSTVLNGGKLIAVVGAVCACGSVITGGSPDVEIG